MDLEKGLVAARKASDRGDDALAIKLLTTLVNEYPNSARAHWELGRHYGMRGAYRQAQAPFWQAAELDPAFSHIEFAVNGHTIHLHDVPGSVSAANLLLELADNPYGVFTTLFKSGDVIIDVGGHIGTISILLAKLHPDVQIITYEPVGAIFDCLVKNLELNAIANVTPVQKAVAGTRGQVQMGWASSDTTSSSMFLWDEANPLFARDTAESVTLEDILAEHEIDRCAWLKLDCEGAEYGIFNSCTVLDRFNRIVMEAHTPAGKDESYLLRILRGVVNQYGSTSPQIVIYSWMDQNYEYEIPEAAYLPDAKLIER